jgi:predicted transcriptional regulator
MSATGIRTYLEPDIAREVARIARAQGRSESSFIADAVRATLAKGSEAVARAAAETQGRRLNRIEARIDKLFRDQALMKESLLLFVRVWLEHNPPLEDSIADSAAASAEARFERFLDLAAQTLARGGAERLHATEFADRDAPQDAEVMA